MPWLQSSLDDLRWGHPTKTKCMQRLVLGQDNRMLINDIAGLPIDAQPRWLIPNDQREPLWRSYSPTYSPTTRRPTYSPTTRRPPPTARWPLL